MRTSRFCDCRGTKSNLCRYSPTVRLWKSKNRKFEKLRDFLTEMTRHPRKNDVRRRGKKGESVFTQNKYTTEASNPASKWSRCVAMVLLVLVSFHFVKDDECDDSKRFYCIIFLQCFLVIFILNLTFLVLISPCCMFFHGSFFFFFSLFCSNSQIIGS